MRQEQRPLLEAERINARTPFLLQTNPRVRVFVEIVTLEGQIQDLTDAQEDDVHASRTQGAIVAFEPLERERQPVQVLGSHLLERDGAQVREDPRRAQGDNLVRIPA